MQDKLSIKEFSKYILRRDIKESKEFLISNEYFLNLYTAMQYLQDNGYSYGSMSLNMPIPIQIGSDYNLHQKWYNLSEGEKKNIDGVILSDDFRSGMVKILIFNK